MENNNVSNQAIENGVELVVEINSSNVKVVQTTENNVLEESNLDTQSMQGENNVTAEATSEGVALEGGVVDTPAMDMGMEQ